MNRRDLSLFAFGAMAASAQDTSLASRVFRFEDLPVRASGKNRSRAVLNGKTHTGAPLEIHQTELAPGLAPHPPHHHVHEEVLLIREGTLEVTIDGKATRLGPGSVAFVASGVEHGWKNAGDTQAHYFIVTLGRAS